MAEVTLTDVWKRYDGGVEAVKAVSLGIEDGEFVVLVGPSGCGKSTTLRMIAGLEEISAGELKIGGRVVNDVAPRDRDIAMVFQSYALYPHMTVRENMAFGLKLRRFARDEIDARVEDAAKMLGLEEFLDRKPKALSGGQRQRVAMGRAIVRQPSVFLFDEPLSNLDAKLRVQMRVEIAALHRRLGTTMVYVTHDQVEAMTLADRIAVMSMGELQQLGSPMDVFHHPKNRFVAGFIGSPAMNFLEGKVVAAEAGDGLVFRGGGVEMALTRAQIDRFAGPLERVTLGVRPQHMAAASAEDASGRGEVVHVELMGAETFAHLKLHGGAEDKAFVLRLPGDVPVHVGDALAFALDAPRAQLFGPDGGNLLLPA